ncbi:hypothetical protein PVK06_012617 [Gossypium arboreum]|uniref:DDE Tnp4 domain-containing protein n=1 Tax=Gossypium arboreum TaxID=29729 RepID=A0ABR0QBV8_GOSAR|nr:hypothetical protein PVK06_012617 [Gossypium arboreum]
MVSSIGNYLGALDGTHIKIRVPTIDKPRYRTRKGDIATNMLGVCTPDMHFVYVLPGWEDRAIGKNAQTAADIIEEIDVEDVATTNTHEERNDFHGYEADVSLDDMDLSATQLQPARNQGDSTFSKKKKKISDASDSSTLFNDAAILLVKNIWTVGLEISKSIVSEVLIQQKSEMAIQESALKLYPTLCEVEGLTEDERYRALNKIPDHPMQMLIFFSLPSAVRLE